MSIYAGMEWDQLAGLDPSPDLVVALPDAEDLAAGNNAMLLAHQIVKRHIGFLSRWVKGKPTDRR